MGINMRFATSLFIAFYIPILFERYHKWQSTSRHNTVDTRIIYIMSKF